MLGSKIFLKDVYSLPLGDQILYWRINSPSYNNPVLEWTIVEKGRNLAASKFSVDNTSSICAMEALEQPEHMVEMDDVDAQLLEQFLEWGWMYPTPALPRISESHCW